MAHFLQPGRGIHLATGRDHGWLGQWATAAEIAGRA